ncbi:hypothetical protein [Neolewinella antarctica]|uniref:Uncharacterized protein n=1 Tax=Neolewinella antarctica TaxID=442734 RepID=A0ABX0X6X7_9BACT|nr:hypothetical protein [Neolewinella antarctica]NJC24815.1 hypothetical protein [Neolewinella antarctica]
MIYCIITSPGYFQIGANPFNEGFGGDKNYLLDSAQSLHGRASAISYVTRPYREGYTKEGETLHVTGADYTLSMADEDYTFASHFQGWDDLNLKKKFGELHQAKVHYPNQIEGSVKSHFSDDEWRYLNGEMKDGRLSDTILSMINTGK